MWRDHFFGAVVTISTNLLILFVEHNCRVIEKKNLEELFKLTYTLN